MSTTKKTKLIIHAFNTKNESAISRYSTKELKGAIVDLDWRNEGDQKAIQYEIDDREKCSDRQYQSYIRAFSYVATLAIGVLVGYIAAKL